MFTVFNYYQVLVLISLTTLVLEYILKLLFRLQFEAKNAEMLRN